MMQPKPQIEQDMHSQANSAADAERQRHKDWANPNKAGRQFSDLDPEAFVKGKGDYR
ncbi:MAG TPA: hypothetical protein VNX88_12920 [Terriglobales bacterium]|jgi:hypothetical protein|nr:hypothetical protein [Terriglobales bacterium]